jgi:hypothetical protein
MATRLSACLWCSIAVNLACGSGALAQAPVRKIRQRMSDTLNRTPDFICSVSIERTERMGKGAPATLPPLDVNGGIINGKELHRVPSTDADQALLKQVLALYSKAGTGIFAMYARAVFLTAAATFYDAPDESKDGRRLSRLDFAMPREASKYALDHEGQLVTLGYSGSIWTDPDNLDVVRLALEADRIPPELGIKAVSQTLDYARASIAGASVLLPVVSDLTLQEESGREVRLKSHFSECGQYLAKGGELFAENAIEAATTVSPGPVSKPNVFLAEAPPVAPAAEPLPAGIQFETILDEPIDERVLSEGSKLSFRVSHDLKKAGKVVVPKGAVIAGHITRIIRQTFVLYSTVKGYYTVGLKLDSVDVGRKRFQVWANLETIGPPASTIGFLPYSHDPDRWGTYDDIKTEFVTPPAAPGESFVGILFEYLRLGRHIRMTWITVAPQKQRQAGGHRPPKSGAGSPGPEGTPAEGLPHWDHTCIRPGDSAGPGTYL